MLIVGIDPGRLGGCVVLLDGAAIAAAHWRTYTRKRVPLYRLAWAVGCGATEERQGLHTPWEIGMALRRWISPLAMARGQGRAQIAAEAAHIGRNARTGLALSRLGGALVGPLESLDPTRSARWLEPDEWRRLVFRPRWWAQAAADAGMVASSRKASPEAPFMPKRDAAKIEASRVLPGLVPGLADLAALVGGAEHVIDAAGVALARGRQGLP